MRGVDGREGTGRRAGARRGTGGGVPLGPGAGEEGLPGSDVITVGGKLVRRSATVVAVDVEGRGSGGGAEEGVPGRTISAGGCRGALGGRIGGLGFSATGSGLSGSVGLTEDVVGSGEGSVGRGRS